MCKSPSPDVGSPHTCSVPAPHQGYLLKESHSPLRNALLSSLRSALLPSTRLQKRFFLLKDGRLHWAAADAPSASGELQNEKGCVDFARTLVDVIEVAGGASQFLLKPRNGGTWSRQDKHSRAGSSKGILLEVLPSEVPASTWICWFKEHAWWSHVAAGTLASQMEQGNTGSLKEAVRLAKLARVPPLALKAAEDHLKELTARALDDAIDGGNAASLLEVLKTAMEVRLAPALVAAGKAKALERSADELVNAIKAGDLEKLRQAFVMVNQAGMDGEMVRSIVRSAMESTETWTDVATCRYNLISCAHDALDAAIKARNSSALNDAILLAEQVGVAVPASEGARDVLNKLDAFDSQCL